MLFYLNILLLNKYSYERLTVMNFDDPKIAPVPSFTLKNGHQIPGIGFGTWPLVGRECEETLLLAIDLGYRLIDTAAQYGNEEAVGKAITRSGVPRSEFFVTSKFNQESHSIDGVQRAYDRSLGLLGLDYLDLFMCHWPVPARDQYTDAWEGLVNLLEYGRVKAIGVSNFKPSHLQKIINKTGVVPDVNQIQLSVDLPRLRSRVVHQELGIVTEAWSPIGRGSNLREHPVVTRIADRHGKTPAQVLLRWHVQQEIVPIPQAARFEWLQENISVFDFALTQEDMEAMARLDRGEGATRDSDAPENGH